MRDLNSKIPGAPNFTYGELIRSDTAKRLGIENIPNEEEEWVNLEKLAVNVLQPIRNQFGPIRITSGYRSVGLCYEIGSTTTSNHTRGQAADLEPFDSSIKLIDIISWVYNNLEYRELIAEYFPAGWIHVAYREGGNNKKLKLKDEDHNYTHMSLSDLLDIYN